VRGAASGDEDMRALYGQTRATLAQRVIDVVADMDVRMEPGAELAVHGWVAFVEECVIRWIDHRPFGRGTLEDLLAKSLPAVVLASTDEEIGPLVAILASDAGVTTG
jgi:hypothetical protein